MIIRNDATYFPSISIDHFFNIHGRCSLSSVGYQGLNTGVPLFCFPTWCTRCVTRVSSGYGIWMSDFPLLSPPDLMVHHLPHFIFIGGGYSMVYLILRHCQMMMIVDPIIIHYPIISSNPIRKFCHVPLSLLRFRTPFSSIFSAIHIIHGTDIIYSSNHLIWNPYCILLSGQDYFKQSNTRLHFIADRATVMSLELLGEPWHMVDEISALGLRHVGYGIPTETWRRTWRRTWRSGTLPPCPWCSHQQSSKIVNSQIYSDNVDDVDVHVPKLKWGCLSCFKFQTIRVIICGSCLIFTGIQFMFFFTEKQLQVFISDQPYLYHKLIYINIYIYPLYPYIFYDHLYHVISINWGYTGISGGFFFRAWTNSMEDPYRMGPRGSYYRSR